MENPVIGPVKVNSGDSDDDEERWMLLSPLSKTVKERTQEYLDRVYSFYLDIDAAAYRKERSLWRILSICAPRCAYISPSLRELALHHMRGDIESIDQTFLTPIISPSIQVIEFLDQVPRLTTLALLHLLRSRDTCFPELKKLTLLEAHASSHLPTSNIISPDALPETLPQLNTFDFDLRMLQPPHSKISQISHEEFRNLWLGGEPQDFKPFFRLCRLPQLKKLTVTIHKSSSLQWKAFLNGLAQCGPAILYLGIDFEVIDKIPIKKLSIEGIQALFPLPLKQLDLPRTLLELSPQEFGLMLNRWPRLERLSLTSCDGLRRVQCHQKDPLYDASLLLAIAKHPSLEHMITDIDFKHLTDPEVLEGMLKFESDSRLQTLEVVAVTNWPVELVQHTNPTMKDQISEFQELIAFMKMRRRVEGRNDATVP
ncbi:hypothetical protein NP233_g6266 [Leucocoprinus birnbaumii]|uniref:Uncharacterized protein n=1 Tax=Leucocoprinus birnbaumii TaxID=56174 RepID=A0AAD5YVY3_9AGAR|nr:hypothetical protein NP233_g6266 [Leucocoprinus birnbaumii]